MIQYISTILWGKKQTQIRIFNNLYARSSSSIKQTSSLFRDKGITFVLIRKTIHHSGQMKNTLFLDAFIVNLATSIKIIARFLSRASWPSNSTILPVSNPNCYFKFEKKKKRIRTINRKNDKVIKLKWESQTEKEIYSCSFQQHRFCCIRPINHIHQRRFRRKKKKKQLRPERICKYGQMKQTWELLEDPAMTKIVKKREEKMTERTNAAARRILIRSSIGIVLLLLVAMRIASSLLRLLSSVLASRGITFPNVYLFS